MRSVEESEVGIKVYIFQVYGYRQLFLHVSPFLETCWLTYFWPVNWFGIPRLLLDSVNRYLSRDSQLWCRWSSTPVWLQYSLVLGTHSSPSRDTYHLKLFTHVHSSPFCGLSGCYFLNHSSMDSGSTEESRWRYSVSTWDKDT